MNKIFLSSLSIHPIGAHGEFEQNPGKETIFYRISSHQAWKNQPFPDQFPSIFPVTMPSEFAPARDTKLVLFSQTNRPREPKSMMTSLANITMLVPGRKPDMSPKLLDEVGPTGDCPIEPCNWKLLDDALPPPESRTSLIIEKLALDRTAAWALTANSSAYTSITKHISPVLRELRSAVPWFLRNEKFIFLRCPMKGFHFYMVYFRFRYHY